jgi:cell wall-associated NlpC family hydrolase
MNKTIQDQIRKTVGSNKETESCGLLVEKDCLIKVFPCLNIAKEKKHNFTINPKDYLRATCLGKIIACYHTHVNEVISFSMKDRLNTQILKLPFICYHVPTDTFYEIKDNTFEYLSHYFELGVHDCYTLVRDYYLVELGFTLPEIKNYNDLFSNFEANLKNLYEKNGITTVALDQIKKHDILLFNFYNTVTPPHFAVYLGNGFILHHPRNGFPQITKLSPFLLKKLICGLRCDI